MIQVVKRVFEILAIFREHGALPLKEVSELSSLQKTTCHNILKSLTDMGILECPKPGVYQIGNELRRLASTPISDKALIKLASNHIERLSRTTGETVVLGVLRGNAVEVLCGAEGANIIVVRTGAHQQGSIYHWATGRILLAHESEPSVRKINKELGAPQKDEWPEIAAHPETLYAELEKIRQLDVIERPTENNGVVSLASPVRRGDGKVIAAVGVSIPGFRAEDTIDQISSELVQIAQAITEDLSEIF